MDEEDNLNALDMNELDRLAGNMDGGGDGDKDDDDDDGDIGESAFTLSPRATFLDKRSRFITKTLNS